jgi:6-phosphogluconate dehydrogenase
MLADIGVIGLAVMGQNLARNLDRHGFRVVVYNRTSARTQEFMAGPAAATRITAAYTLPDLVAALARPRRILLMVQAGEAVDAVIGQLRPLLEPGDILMDGGNSYFADTERRAAALAATGIHYMGIGISGGEEGALWGPSLMPGGPPAAYEVVRPLLEAIAARVDDEPCVTYIGPRGAGHYVKMVHNGIEYGDMQLIAEAYDLLRRGLGLSNERLHAVFSAWNQGPLASYLIEITAAIFAYREEATGQALVDVILDRAGQKGTGRWTGQNALELGVPATVITEAVFARYLSALKDERVTAAPLLVGPETRFAGDEEAFIQAVGEALYAAKVMSYAQGFALLRQAAQAYGYGFDYAEIARIWRGGCIIRAAFLNDIVAAYRRQPDLPNLLLAPFFRTALADRQAAWRHVVATAATLGIPVPALAAALSYYDGYRSARLPANLIQAQRDYFGAHTYERSDRPAGQFFHTNWSGRGGETTAGAWKG